MQINSILGSFLLGLGLCIPNILVQLIMCCLKKNTTSWQNILMNMLLHMGHAFIVAKFVVFGEKMLLYIGIGCILLYVVLIWRILFLRKNSEYLRNPIYSFWNIISCTEKLEYLPDLVSFNRKIPPIIFFYGKTELDGGKYIKDHFGDILVPRETPRYLAYDESFEYIYKSWQDETKLLQLNDISIINAIFELDVLYKGSALSSTQEILRYFDEQRRNGGDTDGLKGDKLWEGYIYKKRCYINRKEHMRIMKNKTCIRRLIGLILFILGYSSIFNTFIRFMIVEYPYEVNVRISKLVSNENDLRAKYNERDENIPDLIDPNERKSPLDINQGEQNQQMEELKSSFL